MNVNEVVVYIDPKGVPKNALVKSLNQLHEGYVSLSYQDGEGRTIDVFDVPHMDDESRQEPNPDLPTFHINCWKYPDEEHNRAPKDHPMFDHPFAPPTLDNDGRRIAKPRPLLDAVVAAHQAGKAADSAGTDIGLPTNSALAAIDHAAVHASTLASEIESRERAKAAVDAINPVTSGSKIETKNYSDGSSATGIAPLPEQSPAQQDAAKAAATKPASEPDVATLLDQAPAAPKAPSAPEPSE